MEYQYNFTIQADLCYNNKLPCAALMAWLAQDANMLDSWKAYET